MVQESIDTSCGENMLVSGGNGRLWPFEWLKLGARGRTMRLVDATLPSNAWCQAPELDVHHTVGAMMKYWARIQPSQGPMPVQSV